MSNSVLDRDVEQKEKYGNFLREVDGGGTYMIDMRLNLLMGVLIPAWHGHALACKSMHVGINHCTRKCLSTAFDSRLISTSLQSNA